MKLHVGSGSVYLLDYVNVDLPGDGVYLASERPDLVQRYATTEDKYYAPHKHHTHESLRGGPLRQDSICDRFGSFASLPARPYSVDEILSRQTFEHLSPAEGLIALGECERVLKYKGWLRLDLPDPDETLKLYRETGDDFWIRHLFGPRRNQYGGHTPYSREMIKAMARSAGFLFMQEEPNIHELYPAFCLRFEKR